MHVRPSARAGGIGKEVGAYTYRLLDALWPTLAFRCREVDGSTAWHSGTMSGTRGIAHRYTVAEVRRRRLKFTARRVPRPEHGRLRCGCKPATA